MIPASARGVPTLLAILSSPSILGVMAVLPFSHRAAEPIRQGKRLLRLGRPSVSRFPGESAWGVAPQLIMITNTAVLPGVTALAKGVRAADEAPKLRLQCLAFPHII